MNFFLGQIHTRIIYTYVNRCDTYLYYCEFSECILFQFFYFVVFLPFLPHLWPLCGIRNMKSSIFGVNARAQKMHSKQSKK